MDARWQLCIVFFGFLKIGFLKHNLFFSKSGGIVTQNTWNVLLLVWVIVEILNIDYGLIRVKCIHTTTYYSKEDFRWCK
jgi:hypothetical protein